MEGWFGLNEVEISSVQWMGQLPGKPPGGLNYPVAITANTRRSNSSTTVMTFANAAAVDAKIAVCILPLLRSTDLPTTLRVARTSRARETVDALHVSLWLDAVGMKFCLQLDHMPRADPCGLIEVCFVQDFKCSHKYLKEATKKDDRELHGQPWSMPHLYLGVFRSR